MGTKNNPGDYDCFRNAHPDEPMFTLLGRDRTAGHLVLIWTALRCGHWAFARQYLEDAIAELDAAGQIDPMDDKLMEAIRCSDEMKEWHRALAAAKTGRGSSALSAADPSPKSESTATPNAGTAAA